MIVAYNILRRTILGPQIFDRALREFAQRFYRFHFRNVGGVVMPLILALEYSDGKKEIVRIPAEIWRRNASEVTWEWVTDRELVRAEIDPNQETADTDRSNNLYARGIETRVLEVE